MPDHDELTRAILDCARGSEAALRRIYDSEAPAMLGTAMRIVRRRDLAEEVVQDAFVQVWRRAETFDPSLPECTVPSPYLGHTPTFMQAAIPVSFSHGWGASPTYLLSRETLGVDTSRLGEGVVAFRPGAAGGLSWARGTIPTPRGDIEASWSAAEGGEYAFEARLPAGLEWSAATSLQNVEAAKDGERTLLTGTFTAARSDYSCV